jgi:hypothetical protein
MKPLNALDVTDQKLTREECRVEDAMVLEKLATNFSKN